MQKETILGSLFSKTIYKSTIDNYDLIIENTSNGEEIKYEKIESQNFEVELQIGNIYSWKITTRDKENNLSSSFNSTFELAN